MNHHKHRIAVLSKVLRFLSLLSLATLSLCALISFFLPAVSVERTYSPPDSMSLTADEEFGNKEKASTEFETPGNRLILQLAGSSPAIEVFSYLPGPSTVREDRAWLAHLIAFLSLSYSAFGALLFWRLFDQFSQGNVFELKSIRFLKHIGFWYIGALPVTHFFTFSKTYWSTDAPMQLSLEGSVFTGIFLFVIAWTMEEAFLMQKDLELTV